MAEQQSSTTDHGQVLLTWAFHEFPRYRRGRRWYVGMIGLGLALLGWSLYDQNPLFAIIVVIGWAIIFFRARQEPILLNANITEDGIEIGKDFYAFDDLAAFWVIYRPPQVKTLYLRFKAATRPILGIDLEDTDPVKLRAVLREYLNEDLDQEDEPASDAYGRMLKM